MGQDLQWQLDRLRATLKGQPLPAPPPASIPPAPRGPNLPPPAVKPLPATPRDPDGPAPADSAGRWLPVHETQVFCHPHDLDWIAAALRRYRPGKQAELAAQYSQTFLDAWASENHPVRRDGFARRTANTWLRQQGEHHESSPR